MCTSMCSWTPWSAHSSSMYNMCMITGYMSEFEISSWKWCALSKYEYTHVPVSMTTNLQNEAYISKMAGDTTSWSTVLPINAQSMYAQEDDKHVHTHSLTYVHTHTRIYTHTNTHTHIYTHVYTRTHTYIHTHTHTH